MWRSVNNVRTCFLWYCFNMKNISIEYAHIYSNSSISKEQEISLKALDEIKEQSKSLVVLVDDYSFPDPTFDYNTFALWLSEKGYSPNLIMRESQLIPLCDQVISILKNSILKNEIVTYIQNKKYPCSVFIASWYLLRLGKLKHSDFSDVECAKKLINILPESFRAFEEKALDIIRGTQYSDCVNQIENRYFEGRSII